MTAETWGNSGSFKIKLSRLGESWEISGQPEFNLKVTLDSTRQTGTGVAVEVQGEERKTVRFMTKTYIFL